MIAFSTRTQTRSQLILAVSMITCLILLINVSFKIIAVQGMIFTASSVLCPLVACFYLLILKECTVQCQRHILNQCLLALYLFSIGTYLLVNLPAAAYMHNNMAYQIVFEEIPRKFFASTLAFGLSFYLPHLLYCSQESEVLLTPQKRLLLALFGGFSFFTLDFLLLFSDPKAYNFNRIYIDSLMIAAGILLTVGVCYLACFLRTKLIKNKIKKSLPSYLTFPLYHYLVGFAVIVMLICLACEYRLVSFQNGLTLAASTILFPLAITASNLIGELFGYHANLRLTVVLIITELAFDLLLMGAISLPSPSFFDLSQFYSFIMPRRIPSATLALFVTFVTNAWLLENLKKTRIGHYFSLRMLIANLCASSLLCLVNYSLLFGGLYPYEQVLNLALSGWTYKLIATLVCIPLALQLLKLFKQQLNSRA